MNDGNHTALSISAPKKHERLMKGLTTLIVFALFLAALCYLSHRFSSVAPGVVLIDRVDVDCIMEDGSPGPCDKAAEDAVRAAGEEDRVLPLYVRPKPYPHTKEQNVPSTAIVDVEIVRAEGERHSDFSVFVDDCIEKITVDGRSILNDILPLCSYPNAVTLDLGPYLQNTRSRFRFELRNKGGGFLFNIVPTASAGSFAAVPMLLAILCLCFFSYLIWSYAGGSPYVTCCLLVFFALGLVLRSSYFLATERHEREHDYMKHIEYIELFATQEGIPAFNECFMCRHPPLYYWLQGSWLKNSGTFPGEATALIAHLHAASFILSLITLALLLYSARVLLADESKVDASLLMLLLAVFPGIILTAGRINNDVLAYPFLFAGWLALWRWWQKGGSSRLGLFVLLLCLGLSVKKLSLVLLPIALVLILFRRDSTLREKSVSLLSVSACVGLSYLVLFSARTMIENKATERLSGVFVPNSLGDFITFNVSRVLTTPYSIPWSSGNRLELFWEYFYRSLFFGEFAFAAELDWLARAMLLMGFVLLGLIARGLYRTYRQGRVYQELPILGILFVPVVVLLSLRIYTTALPMQDFRYIPLFALGAMYYAVRGARGTGILGPVCILGSSGLSMAFFLSLH